MTTIYGTIYDDSITGYSSDDIIYGYEGNDYLYGADGSDLLEGGYGNDTLKGTEFSTARADTMYGGTGNDKFYVDGGYFSGTLDTIIEYPDQGYDEVYSTAINFRLPDNVEYLKLLQDIERGDGNDFNNTIVGNGVANALSGYGGNDYLYGSIDNDYLYGGIGGDYLYGESGNDYLYGEDGNDALNGGTGMDRLAGGTGADFFEFYSVNESTAGLSKDIIKDFSGMGLQNDKIVLQGIDANLNLKGYQQFQSSQLTYNGKTQIFTADVLGGSDLEIQVIGIFSVTRDVIVEG